MKQENRAHGEHSEPIEPIPSSRHEASLYDPKLYRILHFPRKNRTKRFALRFLTLRASEFEPSVGVKNVCVVLVVRAHTRIP